MIWLGIEMIAILAECLMIARLLVEYFDPKRPEKKRFHLLGLASCLLVADLLGTFVIMKEAFFITSFILCGCIYSIFALKGHVLEKIFMSILSYIMIYFSSLPMLFVITNLTDTNVNEFAYDSQNVIRSSSILISKVIYFLLSQGVLTLHARKKYNFKKMEWMIILSAFAATLLIGLCVLLVAAGSTISDYLFIAITVLLCILDIIVFAFVQKLNSINQKEQKQNLLAMQVMQQQKSIAQLDRNYHELSVLRHDFQNRIECICCMLRENKNDEAIRYIESLTDRHFSSAHQHIKSSSSVLNAVINSKFSLAQSQEISTSCMLTATIPHALEYDISALLFNLLDNAIEACKELQTKRSISVSLSEVNGYFRLLVKNTIGESVLQKNRRLRTSKSERNLHGWGLKSVRDIAYAHNGTVDFYEKDGHFVVSVLLMKQCDAHGG